MGEGLITSRASFDALPQREKLGVLFDNQINTNKSIEVIKSTRTKAWVNTKVQYWWLSAITIVVLGLMGIKL